MNILTTLLWTVYIVDSVLLVLIILLQSGRGGGLSGMLGGGGGAAEAALGPKTGLPKITGWMAALFFVSAILIGVMSREKGVLEPKKVGGSEGAKPPAAAPAAEGTKPAKPAEAAEKTPSPGEKKP